MLLAVMLLMAAAWPLGKSLAQPVPLLFLQQLQGGRRISSAFCSFTSLMGHTQDDRLL